jgi:DNA polymerase III delta prime subunit
MFITLGLNGGPVFVRSKKHKLPSRSSSESELITAAAICEEALFLAKLQIDMKLISGIKTTNPGERRFHFVVMDEVDNLTEAAQAGFKAIMGKHHVIFIMTTNNLDKIDAGIQNRSVLIDMNVPPPAYWRPILRRVYTDANLTSPTDAVLDQVVVAGRGSARSIFSDVVMGANQAKRSGQTAVAKIANIRS